MRNEDILTLILLFVLSIATAFCFVFFKTELRYVDLGSFLKDFSVIVAYVFLGLTLVSAFVSGSVGKIVSVYLFLSVVFIAGYLDVYNTYALPAFIVTILISFPLAGYYKKGNVVVLANIVVLVILYFILMWYNAISLIQFRNAVMVLPLILLTIIVILCVHLYRGEAVE